MPSAHDSRRKKAPLARYANYFEINHNAFEFLLDFGQFQPESQSVQFHSRMACGPIHAKLLAEVLRNAIDRFEGEHGKIADLADANDPLELIHASLPDFEQRAAQARDAQARPKALPIPGSITHPDSSQKR